MYTAEQWVCTHTIEEVKAAIKKFKSNKLESLQMVWVTIIHRSYYLCKANIVETVGTQQTYSSAVFFDFSKACNSVYKVGLDLEKSSWYVTPTTLLHR